MEKAAKKQGRPPKPPAEKRSEVLYLKLTPAEKLLITSAADVPAEWARGILLRAAKRASQT